MTQRIHGGCTLSIAAEGVNNAFQRAARAAGTVAAAGPDASSVAALSEAKITAEANLAVMHLAREMSESVIDILA
jgi:hypothetical protein